MADRNEADALFATKRKKQQEEQAEITEKEAPQDSKKCPEEKK